MIFLKNKPIEDLYTLNRESIEKLAAKHGEFVTERVADQEGSYLTNDFKILFDEGIKQDKQIIDVEEYDYFKTNSDKDLQYISNKLKNQYSKDTIVRNIVGNIKGIDFSVSKNKRDVIFFFKDKQKELIAEIFNSKPELKPILKIIAIDEIIEFDKNFVAAFIIFPIAKQRRQLRQIGLLKKIGTRFFIARDDIQKAEKRLKKIYGKDQVILKKDDKLCEKF